MKEKVLKKEKANPSKPPVNDNTERRKFKILQIEGYILFSIQSLFNIQKIYP